MTNSGLRTGIGFDFHRLVEGRDLILGGVKIPYEKGLLGHSDADVLVHSICDALLGPVAWTTSAFTFRTPIRPTREFPASSSWENLRADRRQWIPDRQRRCGRPRRSAENHAFSPRDLNPDSSGHGAVSPQALNLKATTTEGCGMIGRGEESAPWPPH